MSLQRLTERNAAESLPFGSLPFSMERVLGSASGPPDQCVCSGGGLLGHTGELRGLSKFTCPTFQANVFDIEQ